VVEHATVESEQGFADTPLVVRVALAQYRHSLRAEFATAHMAEARAALVPHEHVAGDEVAETRALGALAEVVLLTVTLRKRGLIHRTDAREQRAFDVHAETVARRQLRVAQTGLLED